MVTKDFKITAETGLHAKPSTFLVQTVGKFQSDVKIEANGKTGNMKSLISVMSLSVKKNDVIKVTAEGSDEAEVLNSIEQILKEKELI